MTKLMEKAIEALKNLPESQQDAMAQEVFAILAEEMEWDRLVTSPESQKWLDEAARRAIEAHKQGRTKPIDPSDTQS